MIKTFAADERRCTPMEGWQIRIHAIPVSGRLKEPCSPA
jgi:hypothetical protein